MPALAQLPQPVRHRRADHPPLARHLAEERHLPLRAPAELPHLPRRDRLPRPPPRLGRAPSRSAACSATATACCRSTATSTTASATGGSRE